MDRDGVLFFYAALTFPETSPPTLRCVPQAGFPPEATA